MISYKINNEIANYQHRIIGRYRYILKNDKILVFFTYNT